MSDAVRNLPVASAADSAAQAGEAKRLSRLQRITLLAWSILIALMYGLLHNAHHSSVQLLAETEARARIDAETVLRNWIAARGGVYVPPDADVPPSPFMAFDPHRDVTTRDGQALTLINTSYLTRLLHDSFDNVYGNRANISSERPINPANRPHDWELPAYRTFAAGAPEYSGSVTVGDKEYFFIARALRATANCLKCHTDAGLHVGDLLGALSVRVDAERYRAKEARDMRMTGSVLGIVWLIGMLGIGTAFRIGRVRLDERQAAERDARESHALFQMMSDYASDWIFLRGADGRYRYMSPACETISGYPPTAFYEDSGLMLRLVHPDDRDLLDGHMRAADAHVAPPPLEFRILDRDGREHWIAYSCCALRDGDGNPIGVRGANRDITEARSREKAMMAQSRHAAMGEMINNIAHQWRQPISALGLVLQNLRYDSEDGILDAASMRVKLDKAQEYIHLMSRTVDDFRNFFQPQEMVEFDVAGVVGDAVRMVEDSLRSNGIAIGGNWGVAVRIAGYPNELAQVVINLLVNAKEAILGTQAGDGQIVVDIAVAGQGVTVTVSDNGGGIAADALPHIFDPYFTTKPTGSGVGLYMSKMIVEQHMHGTLRAANAARGARFEVFLPQLAFDPAGK